jgi:hypothetical protein
VPVPETFVMEVAELVRSRGFSTARVATKVNAYGELVVAVLIPPRHPGEWDEANRDQKKASREKR